MINHSIISEHTGTLTISSPAVYQIEVKGETHINWSDDLAGMNITCTNDGGMIITTLIGKLKDQAALAGLLQSLYEMKLPILSVQYKG
jgi:hypothetical protein